MMAKDKKAPKGARSTQVGSMLIYPVEAKDKKRVQYPYVAKFAAAGFGALAKGFDSSPPWQNWDDCEESLRKMTKATRTEIESLGD